MSNKYIYRVALHLTQKANDALNEMCADNLIKTNKLDKSKLICEAIEEKHKRMKNGK